MAERCGDCRFMIVERCAPEAGNQMAFLRCMRSGFGKGRVLLKGRNATIRIQREELRRPAWCDITEEEKNRVKKMLSVRE